MSEKVLIVIDIQNDMTKNYREVIDNINTSIDWATERKIPIVYIRHENLSPGTRTFKPGTFGAELASELNVVSEHVFTKYKGNALTSEAFAEFIQTHDVQKQRVCVDFYKRTIHMKAKKKQSRCSAFLEKKTEKHVPGV